MRVEDVRKMLNGETPIRKCRKCHGEGLEYYCEAFLHESIGLSTIIEGRLGSFDSDKYSHIWEQCVVCEVCDGLGYVED